MDRQEPKLDSDLKDLRFRSPSARHSARASRQDGMEGLPWKIGLAVGIAVLAALLIFNAYERYQARRDAEEIVRAIEKGVEKFDEELDAVLRSGPRPASSRQSNARVIKPVPPGFRCENGTLLKRETNGWTQITARSRQMYCPPGGAVEDCYPVTPRTVGCMTR